MPNLKNMGIYDLRNYARHLGVLHPTMLKRNELECEIANKLKFPSTESIKQTKGRPIKSTNFSIPEKILTIDNKAEIKRLLLQIKNNILKIF